MTPLVFVALVVAGGVGAVARFVFDGLVRSRRQGPYPLGTLLINLSGSLGLGLLVGFVAGHALPDAIRDIAGVGFLGGYTTFSTASFETVRLLQGRRRALAALNGLGMLIATVALATFGLLVGAVS